ncbi:hypothetical protein WSM22_39860 [Cytophagales bacterium WSM2-2]|nr:hypothetical protein WSM22_39860 [Cytophagales bacterium WSM2-2]
MICVLKGAFDLFVEGAFFTKIKKSKSNNLDARLLRIVTQPNNNIIQQTIDMRNSIDMFLYVIAIPLQEVIDNIYRLLLHGRIGQLSLAR